MPDDEAFEREYPGAQLLSSKVARQLELTGALIESQVGNVFRRHGLSHAAGNALAVIEGARRPITPTEVGAAMHITSGSMTSLLDTLEKRGLVQRSSHDEDRRKIVLDITPEGEAMLDRALPEVQALARAMLSALTNAERAKLLALLEKAHASAGAVEEIPTPPGPRRPPWRKRRA